MPGPCEADPVIQLDGGPQEGGDCVAAADAMLIERATCGAVEPTARHIRALTEDVIGGLTLDQVRYVNAAFYGIASSQNNALDFEDFSTAAKKRGAIALIHYGTLVGTKWDCFKGNFSGNHALWVDSYDAATHTFHYVDPGADGRPDGSPDHHVPKGYQTMPYETLRKAAGGLVIDEHGHTVGLGNVQVLFAPPDPTHPPVVNPPSHPVVVTSGPKPDEVNVMIAPAWGTSATHRMALAKGQPIFRSPGGKRLTSMSAAKAVPYIGRAGTGWCAVLVGTGIPYKDHKTRPTVGYVPAAAGPIS